MTTPKEKYPFGQKVLQDLLLLAANDEYKADMEKLQKKYSLPSIDDQTLDGKEELEFLKSPKLIEMIKDYLDLMDKYRMSYIFYYLMSFILDNGHLVKALQGEKVNIDTKEIASQLLLSSGIQIIKNNQGVTLNLLPGVTIKDVQKIWPEISSYLNKNTTRKKGSDNLERDLEILKLKNKGLKAREITSKINSDPRFKDKKISYQEIYRIIKKLKSKAKKNMPHKDS